MILSVLRHCSVRKRELSGLPNEELRNTFSLEAWYLIKEWNSLPFSKHFTFIGNSMNFFIVEFVKFCRVA